MPCIHMCRESEFLRINSGYVCKWAKQSHSNFDGKNLWQFKYSPDELKQAIHLSRAVRATTKTCLPFSGAQKVFFTRPVRHYLIQTRYLWRLHASPISIFRRAKERERNSPNINSNTIKSLAVDVC